MLSIAVSVSSCTISASRTFTACSITLLIGSGVACAITKPAPKKAACVLHADWISFAHSNFTVGISLARPAQAVKLKPRSNHWGFFVWWGWWIPPFRRRNFIVQIQRLATARLNPGKAVGKSLATLCIIPVPISNALVSVWEQQQNSRRFDPVWVRYKFCAPTFWRRLDRLPVRH